MVDSIACPSALAVVPGFGFAVRVFEERTIQMYSHPDTVAMWFMSAWRVVWIAAVVKGSMLCKQG